MRLKQVLLGPSDIHFKIFKKYSWKIVSNTDFSVWLRTGYNPADINRFRCHTGKCNKSSLIDLIPFMDNQFKIEFGINIIVRFLDNFFK